MVHLSRTLFCVMFLFIGSAFAQNPLLPALAASSGSAAEKTSELRTIAIGDIPQRMLEERQFMQGLVQRAVSAEKTETLVNDLGAIRTSVNTLSEKLMGTRLETLPLSGQEALERHLTFLGERLKRWQDDFQAISRPISDDAGELAQRKRLWLDTRQQFEAIVPASLLSSIDELNDEIRQAENQVSKLLAHLLDLNREASLVHARVSNGLLTLRSQISRSDRNLWRFDAENLITAFQNSSSQTKGNIADVVDGVTIEFEFMKAFNKAETTRHLLLTVLAVLALPVLIYLSRVARRSLSRDPGLERFASTLSRPVSGWLLVIIAALLVADFEGARLQLKLLLVVAWLPVMRLQPRWVHDRVGHWLYSTALFFLISIFAQLITTLPFEFRVTLLVSGVLLLGTLGWLLYHLSRQSEYSASSKSRIAKLLVVVYMSLIALAVLANILGGVHLAALLTDASLKSAYLGLVLLAVSEFFRAYAQVLVMSGAQRIESRTRHASRLFEVGSALFNLVLTLVWLGGTIGQFRMLRPLRAALSSLAGYVIEFGSISITVGGVVLFCVSVFLSFWIAKTIRSVLSEDVLPNMTLPRGVANSVSTMTYYFLLMLGLLVALSAAGFQLSQLALVVGALSVGIGLGLQSVVNNFVSGIILMIERPIQPGDTVELSGTTGKVRDIGIRTTTLSTFDGADVVVPNGMLLSEKMTNWTLSNDRRRIEIPVGVAYGSDPRTVQSLLLTVANQTQGVNREPPPAVLFMGFGESSLDFSVRAWIDQYDQSATIRSEMAIAIHDALKGAGIDIPFPQRDLNIRTVEAGASLAALPVAAAPAPYQDCF